VPTLSGFKPIFNGLSFRKDLTPAFFAASFPCKLNYSRKCVFSTQSFNLGFCMNVLSMQRFLQLNQFWQESESLFLSQRMKQNM